MKFLALILIVCSSLAFTKPVNAEPWEPYLLGFVGFTKEFCEEFDSGNCTKCVINLNATILYITDIVNILMNITNLDIQKLLKWITMEFPLIAEEGRTCLKAYDLIENISAYIQEAAKEKQKYYAKFVADLLEEVMRLPTDIKIITNYTLNHEFEKEGEEIAKIFLRIFHPEL